VPAGSHAGSYDITPSGAADPDYTITLVNGTLDVLKANQTITWPAPPRSAPARR